MLGVPTNLKPKEAEWKQLVTKIAWALGTTLDVPYSGDTTWARSRALAIANRILRDLAGLKTAPGTLFAPVNGDSSLWNPGKRSAPPEPVDE